MADDQTKNIVVGEQGWPAQVYLFILGLIILIIIRLIFTHPPSYKVGQNVSISYSVRYPIKNGFWYKNLFIKSTPSTPKLRLGHSYHLQLYIDGVLSKGIYQTKYKAYLVKVESENPLIFGWWWQKLNQLNSRFSSHLESLFPWPTSALMEGLIFGQKEDLGQYKSKFQKTGTIHIVAASGFNVMLVFGFVFYLLIFFLSRRLALIITLFFIWFYALLIGLQPPVIRATTMASLLILSQLLHQSYPLLYAFFLGILLILLIQPQLIFSLSFQLSAISTLGLILLASYFVSLFRFLPVIIREDVGVSMAAQIFTWPIISFYFGSWNLISFLANALILWTIPFLTIGGSLLLFYHLLPWHPLANFFAFIFWIGAHYLFLVVNFLAKPHFLILHTQLNYPLTIAYYLFLALGLRFLAKRIPHLKPPPPGTNFKKSFLFVFGLSTIIILLSTPLLPQDEVRIISSPTTKIISIYSQHHRLILLPQGKEPPYSLSSQLLYPWERKIDFLVLPENTSPPKFSSLKKHYLITQIITPNNNYSNQFFQLININGNLMVKTSKYKLFWALKPVLNYHPMLESNIVIAPASELKIFSSLGSRQTILIPFSTNPKITRIRL